MSRACMWNIWKIYVAFDECAGACVCVVVCACIPRFFVVPKSSALAQNMRDDDADYKAWKAERRRLTAPFDIERWYPTIMACTFPTSFVHLTPDEAKAMIAVYDNTCLHKRMPTHEERKCIVQVRQRISDAMHTNIHPDAKDSTETNHNSGYFVRLSTRSPKDGAMPTREAFEEEAARRQGQDEPDDLDADVNCKMRAFFEVGFQSLRVHDADGAMQLLLASERVHRDLYDVLLAGSLEEMKVAIRRWEPLLRQEYEFRAFVKAGQLTAISQYNPYCFFPEQVAAHDELIATLEGFWSTRVADLLAPLYEDYVIDLALLANGDCCVVELNPFEPQTGGGLFVWENPEDLALLERGPLTLRLAKAPPPRMQTTLEVFVSELPRSTA